MVAFWLPAPPRPASTVSREAHQAGTRSPDDHLTSRGRPTSQNFRRALLWVVLLMFLPRESWASCRYGSRSTVSPAMTGALLIFVDQLVAAQPHGPLARPASEPAADSLALIAIEGRRLDNGVVCSVWAISKKWGRRRWRRRAAEDAAPRGRPSPRRRADQEEWGWRLRRPRLISTQPDFLSGHCSLAPCPTACLGCLGYSACCMPHVLPCGTQIV